MIINVVIGAGEKLRSKAKYGFTVLFLPMRVTLQFSESFVESVPNIFYGNQLPQGIDRIFRIRPSVDFEECISEMKSPDIGGIEHLDFGGKRLPRLFAYPDVAAEDVVDFDIAAATFALSSNWQDLISMERDEFDRLRAMDSLQDRLACLDFPVVNYYSSYLAGILNEFFKLKIEMKKYDGKGSAIALTHDVDYTSSLNPKIIKRDVLGHALMNNMNLTQDERMRKFLNPFYALLGYDPPRDGLAFLRDFEKEEGLRSTFFIKSGVSAKEDVGYGINSGRMRKFIGSLLESGFEIGIHPSMKTYIDAGRFMEEKKKLQEVTGTGIESVRQHYLKFTAGTTTGIWEEAGLKYDSTLGFSRKTGFRNSVAFPFPLYSFRRDSVSDVVELPLILMDGTIADNRSLSKDETHRRMSVLIEETRKANGAAAILFHNSLLDPIDFPNYPEIYKTLVREIKSVGTFVGPLSEVVRSFS